MVHATNECSSLDFQFPSSLAECQSISNEFSLRSKAGFTNSIGCIDGLLIWLEKTSKDQCNEVGVDCRKFLCGPKRKFGLNLQGICDARRRFTYISIQHPASASDYLAYVTSALYGHLTNDDTALPNGYCLYGDNAYVNDTYMAVPYPMISSGSKDAYNFYHSQVRINIECTFGILVNRWRILKTLLIHNRDSPNGYSKVMPAELQSVTLSHQVDPHKTLTTHKLACSCFAAIFGYQ